MFPSHDQQPVLYVQVNVWNYQTTQEEYFNLFVINSNNEVIFMLNNKSYPMDLYDLIMRELALDFINPDSPDSVIFVKCEKSLCYHSGHVLNTTD